MSLLLVRPNVFILSVKTPCNFQECTSLLVHPNGTLLLTLDSLKERPGQATATLADLGVTRLNKDQAEQVIKTRVDLDNL